MGTVIENVNKENKKTIIVEILPGQELPEGYADYRTLLQRDGLILYAWEFHKNKIRIVWITANQRTYKYQTWADNEKDLKTICPKEKYETVPFLNKEPIANKADFIIYAAPSVFSANMKTAFIAKLKEAGSTVNFDYDFSLGRKKAEQERAKLDTAEKTAIGEYMRTLLMNQGEA